MNEFEHIGRKLPYDLSPQQFDALKERIRRRTTARQEPTLARRRTYRLSLLATAAAVVMFAVGLFVAELREQPQPGANIEQMLQTASAETLQQAAAENYDDILFNQQL